MMGRDRSYLNDYHKAANGTYVYTGKYMVYSPANPLPYKKWETRVFLLGAAALTAAAVGGILPVEGLKNCPYIILPHALGVVCAAWAVFSLFGQKISGSLGEKLKLRDHSVSFGRVAPRCIAAAVFLLIGAVGCAVFRFTGNTEESLLYPAVYIVLLLFSSACEVFLFRTVKNAVWTEE